MRLLRVSTPYPAYLKKFYAERRGLGRQPFEVQQNALLTDGFQQIDSYSWYLKAHGYECQEVMANSAPLLQAWCRENGVAWQDEDFDLHACLQFAKCFKPEVVFLANARRFSKGWIDALKEACPRVRCILGWWGVDIGDAKLLRGFDVVLTCNKELEMTMKNMGCNVERLPFAFDPRILQRIDCQRTPTISVSFLGSVRRADGFHRRRAQLLEQLSEQFNVEVYTEHREPSRLLIAGGRLAFELCGALRKARISEPLLRRLPLMSKVCRWRVCPETTGDHSLWNRVRPPLYGRPYYQALRDSSVTLNIHPECAGQVASNIRLFEASGVGSCLLTDWKRDLRESFELDSEVVAFKNDFECIEKLRWLLDHEEQRASLARAGQRRTLQQHHFAGLADRLHEVIARNLK